MIMGSAVVNRWFHEAPWAGVGDIGCGVFVRAIDFHAIPHEAEHPRRMAHFNLVYRCTAGLGGVAFGDLANGR